VFFNKITTERTVIKRYCNISVFLMKIPADLELKTITQTWRDFRIS